jgi:hypothetical protein
VSETELSECASHGACINAAEYIFVCHTDCPGPSTSQSFVLHCVCMCACTSDEVQGRVRSRTVEFKYRQRIFSLIMSELSDAHMAEVGACKFNHVY